MLDLICFCSLGNNFGCAQVTLVKIAIDSGSPISKVKVSSPFKFFNPSTVAIISASVGDGDPIRYLELLEPRKYSPILISSQYDCHHHDESPRGLAM